MKQLSTLLVALAAIAIPMQATDYTGTLSVTVSGQACEPTEQTITVEENTDGTYNMSLKNFILTTDGESMPIGNIELNNVNATASGDASVLKTSQNITISAGDDASKTWYGPLLTADGSTIPVNMIGVLQQGKFRTVIGISFSGLDISVSFANDKFQIPNSDFELFHTATYGSATSDEPNHWHSFMSCTGDWTKYVSGTPHTFTSEDVRPGSTGKKSVKVTSGIVKVLFVSQPANGTLTTGRLQAGSTSATNTANCAFLDMSTSDKDANGDPFYVSLEGYPDSINVWVKFKQGTLSESNANYKYATISSTLTDGTYYQDPEDKTYTNVVGKAKNNQIESNDAQWQQLSIPFDYASYAAYNVQPKALLVTMSTNAQPGVASTDADNPDEFYVDDLTLVYNAKLSQLKVKGTSVSGFDKDTKEYSLTMSGTIEPSDIEAVSDGQGAYVIKEVENTDGGVVATVTVAANDLSTQNVYTLHINGSTTGINRVEASQGNDTTTIYNLNGQRVGSMNQSGLYIIRRADGSTQKVLKK